MRRFLRENSLSLVMFGAFFLILGGQIVVGLAESNQDRQEHGQEAQPLGEYLGSGHFIEAVFENWESEFLQIGAFVLLTVKLRQKGSPESKKLEGDEAVDAEPNPRRKGAPWPVRKDGLVLKVYEHSLTITLFGLFLLSFWLHALGGATEYSEQQLAHGEEPVTALAYVGTNRFWFESLQNWQSEFLSIGVLVVLSVFLREKGSPESKPVDHPIWETGSA